nr:MAG TPA: hypothetical protein [Caudoviricetes sp.]
MKVSHHIISRCTYNLGTVTGRSAPRYSSP